MWQMLLVFTTALGAQQYEQLINPPSEDHGEIWQGMEFKSLKTPKGQGEGYNNITDRENNT